MAEDKNRMDVEVHYKRGRPIEDPYVYRDQNASSAGSGNTLTINLHDGTVVKLHGFNLSTKEK